MSDEITVHAEPAALALMPNAGRLDRNPAAVYIGSLGSEGSRRTMKDALRVAVEFFTGEVVEREQRDAQILRFPWQSLRYQHVQRLRSELGSRYAPASANKMLTAVKQVINEARKLGLVSADEAMRATKDVKRVKGERVSKGRALSSTEIAALLAATDKAPPEIAARDRFMLKLLLYSGLRRQEAAELTLGSVADGAVRMVGKGNKERVVPMNESLRASLDEWLRVRGRGAGPLLFKATKEGRLLRGKTLTGATIFARVRRLAATAGIKTFGPHDCRRTFATTLLARGVPIETVSRLMGHSDIATTQKYNMQGAEAAKAAVEKLDY